MPLFGKPNIARLEAKANLKALHRALDSTDTEICLAAARALGRLRRSESTGALISAMVNQDDDVAVAAAEALGEIGDPAAVEALSLMLRPPPIERRLAALRALANIGTETALDAILSVLDEDDTALDRLVGPALARLDVSHLPRLLPLVEAQEQRTRAAVTAAFQAMGERGLVGLQELAQGQDPILAKDAVSALAAVGTPASLEMLTQMLGTPKYDLREQVNLALKAVGTPAVAPLVAAANGESQQLRRTAIQLLGEMGESAAIPALAEISRSGSRAISRTAVQALGQLALDEKAPALIEALGSDDWLTRQHAARGLANIWPNPESIAALTESLFDENSSVRKEALQTLQTLGWEPETTADRVAAAVITQQWEGVAELGPGAISPLAQMIPHLFSAQRSMAAKTVARLGETAFDALSELLAAPDTGVRAAAAEGLGKLGNHEAIPLLMDELQREDGTSAAATASALGELRAHEALHALEQALLTKSTSVRAAAALALAQLDQAGEAALLAATHSEDEHVVRSTSAALAQIGSKRAIERLLDLVSDARQPVHREALRAAASLGAVLLEPAATRLRVGDSNTRTHMAELLAKLGTRQVEGPLLRALWHPELETRVAAARALESLGPTAVSQELEPKFVRSVYLVTFSRVVLSDQERQWFEGEAMSDLARQEPALDQLHTRLAAEQSLIVGTVAPVGPFGHNLISMTAWFKAWLLSQGVRIDAWCGWFYHREITVVDDDPLTMAVLVYYQPQSPAPSSA